MAQWHEQLGEPSLELAALKIWIHGRQFPEAQDYWDGNWLRGTAHCAAEGASVRVSGSFVTVPDLIRWREACEKLYGGQIDEAEFVTLEPELFFALKRIDKLGHLQLTVEITPNHVHQRHEFEFFDLDQSFLPEIIQRCRVLEQQYPVRGEAEAKR